MIDLNKLDLQAKRILAHVLLESPITFTRFFYRDQYGSKFLVNQHHKILSDVFKKVYSGEIKRLIINIPPGYSKTVMAVIGFVAQGFAKNPRAKFLFSSYSDDLVSESSTKIRDIICSESFQHFWPIEFREDQNTKKRWNTKQGGCMVAAPSGGAITGFRAGLMESGFTGALILDDPLKPEDALSVARLNAVNNRFNNTFRSRLANESIPIVIIMQRLHENDLSSFLLRGGSEDIWDHLVLPIEISDDPPAYPHEYSFGRRVDYNIPAGPLWHYKHNQEQINKLKKDKYTYYSQYMQTPTPFGGVVFDRRSWKYYEKYNPRTNKITVQGDQKVKLIYKHMYIDSAMKTESRHDYSVIQLWGMGEDGRIYLLDQLRGKYEAPELKKRALEFFDKHEYHLHNNVMGVRSRKIEDKASGIGLIQEIQALRGRGYVEGIPRDRDKVSRAYTALPALDEGLVCLPSDAIFLPGYLEEFDRFTAEMTHRYDDQIDPTLDAIQDMILNSGKALDYSGFGK